ncbi:uncharacterized protein LOC125212099 [Salvia hispanica]|uniref:uncharacterized protein LOC125212099 n=1 Tax=Salvia hispanica TaxID=49212 RepID=UPI002009A73F|nr:uncharacterized protein LOC125212099 [Salvia hispanica]
MSGAERNRGEIVMEDAEKSSPIPQQEEAVVKKKYGGMMPKKPLLISKDHERAYFDSADWALGKPKGPLEALRQSYSLHSSRPSTASLSMHHRKENRDIHHYRKMELQTNEKQLVILKSGSPSKH